MLTIQLKPHISTLDFFLFSIRVIETYLTVVELKRVDEINKMWCSDFTFKAGSQCVENDSLTACCKLLTKSTENAHEALLFEVNILGAKIRLRISIPESNTYGTVPSASLSPVKDSYYLSAYKRTERNITDIVIDSQDRSLTANVELILSNEIPYGGLGKNYMPCVTFCDLILIGGQLSQIILYETDQTNRDEASNLWLRKIHIINEEPISGNVKIRVEVKKNRTIDMKGLLYSCADVVIDFNDGHLIAECDFAYQPFAE